jgi:serine/threonine protein phosphatase PrpC
MDKFKQFFKQLLISKGQDISEKTMSVFNGVTETKEFKEAVDLIILTQEKMLNIWKRKLRLHDFLTSSLVIPNATVGKPYNHIFDQTKPPLDDIIIDKIEINGVEDFSFDKDSLMLSINFLNPGDYVLRMNFSLKNDGTEEAKGVKEFKVLVNPDPKTLWKDLPSDSNDIYWKENNISASLKFGNKQLILASKRGRSHAHEGIFRDDDYAYFFNETTNWGIVAVADGAGSAKYSRKGSSIACQSVVDYFKQVPQTDLDQLANSIIAEINESNEVNQKAISSFCLTHLGKAAFSALTLIKNEANEKGATIKEYSTTLLFYLFKEFDSKLFVTSFWVGDGCVGVYSKDPNYIHILGVPDSGEFSGQTRFLTMSEIFADNAYVNRIKYKIVDKNCTLFLMTDGITDPKFQTDAALEKIEIWNNFINDLEGSNDDDVSIDFNGDLKLAEESLMKWMDFWSAGNHDDRTLAILF